MDQKNLLEGAAILQGATEGDFVGVFEIATGGQPACRPGHIHAERREEPVYIRSGRFTRHVEVHGQNDLGRLFGFDPLKEFLDLQLFRSDSFDGRNRAVQHVIATVIGTGSFERDQIERLLNDADRCGSGSIGADGAGILLGDVEAARAKYDPVFHVDDRFGQSEGFLARCAQKVKRQA